MSRANTIQTNFTSGELSPNMYGRVDVSKYFNGTRKQLNMISLPQGGAIRRPGTYYLGSVYDNTKKVFVRPFIFSNNDSYVMEFGHQTVRFWQSGTLVGAPLVLATPYSDSEVKNLHFAQSADVIFITHPNYYPRVITRTGLTTFTIGLYVNKDGPYLGTTPDLSLKVSNVIDRATATCASSIFSTSGGTATITNVQLNSSTTPNIKITTSAAHGFVDGDSVLIRSVVGVNECLGAWIVGNITGTTFTLNGSRKSSTSSYVSGGTAIKCSCTHVEFRENNLYKIAQVIDITSGTVATVDVSEAIIYPPSNVVTTEVDNQGVGRMSVTSDVALFRFDERHYYIRPNIHSTAGTIPTWCLIYEYLDSLTVHGSKLVVGNYDDPSKEVVITSRTNTGTVTLSGAYFAATDVGRMLRVGFGAQWVVGAISAYTSSTVATALFTTDVPLDPGAVYKLYNSGVASSWKIGAWSATTGYPAVVAFHQGRIGFASTTVEPTAVWLGVSGDFYNFESSDPETSAVNDDHAITILIVSRQVNVVRWMESGPVLLVGTEGAEWQIKPSSIAQTLTPTNVSATQQTTYGSMNVDAHRIGSQTVFVERNSLKLREMAYDYSIDAFTSKDISILSEHLLRENAGIVDWAVQANPYSFLWLVTTNGKLIGVTYEKEHDVVAWHQHDVSGSIESCCVIPTSTGEDELYLVVARTINGTARKYVERISHLLGTGQNYSDCGVTVSYGTPTAVGSLTGFSHLAATAIDLQVDGVYANTTNVTGGGGVTIGFTGMLFQFGITTDAIIEILDPEGGSQAGTSQGKKKRVTESFIRVYDSWYPKIASAQGVTNETENLMAGTDITSADYTRVVSALQVNHAGPSFPVVYSGTFALVSGDIAFSVDDAFDNGGRFLIVQDEPYPLNVVCIGHKLNTNE